jgi:branched-chain amino acid transport system permease protein
MALVIAGALIACVGILVESGSAWDRQPVLLYYGPYLLLLLIALVRPWHGTSRLEARPIAALPPVATLIVCGVAVLLLASMPLWAGRDVLGIAAYVAIYGLFALSLNISTAVTGRLSFCHGAYFAIGGCACAILLARYHWPLILSLPTAAMLSGLAAAAVGAICIRLRYPYDAIVTLAFAILVSGVAINWPSVTGGRQGLFVMASIVQSPVNFYYLVFSIVTGSTGALWLVWRIVLNHQPQAPAALSTSVDSSGFSAPWSRWQVFVYSGVFAGAAGALVVLQNMQVDAPMAAWPMSVRVIWMALLGGAHSFFGPIVGAAAIIFFDRFVFTYFAYESIALCMMLFLVMSALPDGLVGLVRRPTTLTLGGSAEETPAGATQDTAGSVAT